MKHLYTSSQAESRANGRPVGVSLISLLCFVGVLVLGVYGAQSLAVLRDPPTAQDAATARALLPLIATLLPLLLVIGVGLWRLRNWARYLAATFLGIGIVYFFIDGLLRYPASTGLLLGLSRSLVPIAIILYLLHRGIGAVFRAKSGD